MDHRCSLLCRQLCFRPFYLYILRTLLGEKNGCTLVLHEFIYKKKSISVTLKNYFYAVNENKYRTQSTSQRFVGEKVTIGTNRWLVQLVLQFAAPKFSLHAYGCANLSFKSKENHMAARALNLRKN